MTSVVEATVVVANNDDVEGVLVLEAAGVVVVDGLVVVVAIGAQFPADRALCPRTNVGGLAARVVAASGGGE